MAEGNKRLACAGRRRLLSLSPVEGCVSALHDRHEDGVAKHAVDKARIAYNPLSDETRLFIDRNAWARARWLSFALKSVG